MVSGRRHVHQSTDGYVTGCFVSLRNKDYAFNTKFFCVSLQFSSQNLVNVTGRKVPLNTAKLFLWLQCAFQHYNFVWREVLFFSPVHNHVMSYFHPLNTRCLWEDTLCSFQHLRFTNQDILFHYALQGWLWEGCLCTSCCFLEKSKFLAPLQCRWEC